MEKGKWKSALKTAEKARDKSIDGYTLSYYVGIVSRIDGTHD